ncbi:unnamed protein product [Ascophyllum nodosum]
MDQDGYHDGCFAMDASRCDGHQPSLSFSLSHSLSWTHLNACPEQRPVFFGEMPGDDETDANAAHQGHQGVERGEEVGYLERAPMEPEVEVVVADGEDIQREDEQEVAQRDLQQQSINRERTQRQRFKSFNVILRQQSRERTPRFKFCQCDLAAAI